MRIIINILILAAIASLMAAIASLMVGIVDLVDEIKELKTDVAMYESMVEGLMLTNKEQHNMLLECMEGDIR